MVNEKKKNGFGSKLAFGAADFFGGGAFNIINFLYPGFLAMIVGLPATVVGIIMLVSKFFDAAIDPFIGYLSDRTKSRLGKRRIYLLVVAPIILLSMFFLFFPYNMPLMALRIFAVVASYLIFTLAQSMIMIPYYSLASEISSNYQVRASYNSVRLGISIISSIICVSVPGIILGLFKDDIKTGYQVMSLAFGFIFMVMILITAIFAREEIITEPSKDKLNLKGMIRPLKVKAFRQYLYLFLMVQVPMAVMSAVFFFYIDFYITASNTLNQEATMVGSIAAALLFLVQVVALPLYLKMIEKKGKMFTYRFGSLIWIIGCIALFFLPKDVNPIFIYLIATVVGFGISAPGLIPHAMFGDVVDVGELELKERLDGQMSGFGNFVNQFSQGVGVFLTMTIIGLAGFLEQDITPGVPLVVSQSDSAMLAIRLVLMLTPILFLIPGIIISYKYKVNASNHAKVREAIENNIDDIELIKEINNEKD